MKEFKVYLTDNETRDLQSRINDGTGDKIDAPNRQWYAESDGELSEHLSYTIGDLLKYLQYDYWYNVMLRNNGKEKLVVHRRLCIRPVPVASTYKDYKNDDHIIRGQYESEATNDKDDYVWRVSYDGEIFGESVNLIDALRDACLIVHDRGLWKTDRDPEVKTRTFSLTDV